MLPDVDMGIIHAGQPEVGEGKGAARLTLRRSELEVFSEKNPAERRLCSVQPCGGEPPPVECRGPGSV